MDCYKPIYTSNELKKECKKLYFTNKSKLDQAKALIKKIQQKREENSLEISQDEWQALESSEVYCHIAYRYHQKRLRNIRLSREFEDRFDFF